MPGLQDIVYALEVGNLRRWILRLAVIILLAGLGIFYMVRQFNGLSEPMAMDLAQIGRQIALGHGFSTQFLRPMIIKENKEKKNLAIPSDIQRSPDVIHAPLYPYLLGGAFKLTGTDFSVKITELKDFSVYPPEKVIIFTNILFLVLAVVVFYLWMLRSFDDRVAIISCGLLVASDLVWDLTISGLPLAPLMFLLCLAGFCINESLLAEESDAQTSAAAWWATAALAVSGMGMTSYPMLVLVPAMVGFAFLVFVRRNLMVAIALVLPVLVCIPWIIRNINLTGNPFGFAWVEIFVDNGSMPGDSIWRVFGEDPSRAYGLKPLLRALALGLANISTNFSAFFGGAVIPCLFLAGLIHVFRRSHCQQSRWFWVASLTAVILCNAAIIKLRPVEEHLHLNLLLVFLPVLAGYGVAFLFVMINRLQLPSTILVIPIFAVVCLLQIIPLGVRLIQRPAPPYSYPPYFPPVFVLVGSWLDEKEIQAMDVPWAGAWYSNRTTIWLPLKREDFFALNDFTVKISAMLLTPYSSEKKLYSEVNTGEFRDWAPLIRRSDFRELPLPQVTVLPPNKDDYMYFSDKIRWR
ncbi:MAG: glycosyltransferase family 39 protein [Candidatus Methylacidiphilales bacterium]|nr:glycosyltransferase family 39 protein [Candidatus Methylacidiphilales bacterium]